MSEDSSRYCTLIDKFGEVSKKNADYKKVFELLASLCMLSMLTKRVTFLLPVGKALKELEKMAANKQREHLKRHIIGGAFDKEELEGRERVYTRATIDKSRRIAYLVSGKGASLTIGGVKVGKVVVKVVGSTRDGKEIPTGIAYEIDELLPEAGEEVPMLERQNSKSKGKSKGKPHVQKGGNPTVYLVDRDIEGLLDLSGHDLRWAIIEQYRNSWPLTVFGIDSEYSWYNWASASLVSFLAEQIPNFYWVYSPYLGLDPFATLDLLFEYHVKDSYYDYILSDELIKQWIKSSLYMYSDPVLLTNTMTYLAGGGAHKSGGNPWETLGIYGIISLNADVATRYVATGKEAIEQYMKYNSPEKLREGIVKVYKKVYSEPDILLGETRTIYEKVDEKPFIVALQNDLRRFMDDRFRYHTDFDSLYPSFLNCDTCNPNKSKGFLSWFGLGGANGKKKKRNAKWTVESILQYNPDTLTIELDSNSSDFRFPQDFILDFIKSPWFLWMPALNVGKKEIKTPFDKEFKLPDTRNDMEIVYKYTNPIQPQVPPQFPSSSGSSSSSSSGSKVYSARLANLYSDIISGNK
jgi:hypothetical protein